MDSRASCNSNFRSLATYFLWDPLQQATRYLENFERYGEEGIQNTAYSEELIVYNDAKSAERKITMFFTGNIRVRMRGPLKLKRKDLWTVHQI